MARRRKRRSTRRRSYRRRGLSGLLGVSSRAGKSDIKSEALDILLVGAGAIAAAKGASMLDKMVNKGEPSKLKSMIAPAAITIAGVAGAVMLPDRLVKSLAKGVAVGGAIKLAEKALGKENLLAGVDDDGTPLMLPGVGDIGQSHLPELSHYSENPAAPVTATGADYEYHMGTPSEVLNGDDDFIAV